jgi:hypothetical protein
LSMFGKASKKICYHCYKLSMNLCHFEVMRGVIAHAFALSMAPIQLWNYNTTQL